MQHAPEIPAAEQRAEMERLLEVVNTAPMSAQQRRNLRAVLVGGLARLAAEEAGASDSEQQEQVAEALARLAAEATEVTNPEQQEQDVNDQVHEG